MKDQHCEPSGLGGIPDGADDLASTPVDYIVVGSGAGGGPLAARLARNGMRVLVLEAGGDPGVPLAEDGRVPDGAQRQEENGRLLYYCPGLHAASTEPDLYKTGSEDTAWGFRVRHFADDAWQRGDSKAFTDPATGKSAVLYPRSSALGGCTAHHAMISIYGSDYDWQKIADLTGDNSWAPGKMRAIYQRLERDSLGIVQRWLRNGWERFLRTFLRRHAAAKRPRRRSPLSQAWAWFLRTFGLEGGRGKPGWLDVQSNDPKLAMGDSSLFRVIVTTVLDVEGLSGGIGWWRTLKWLASGRFFNDLDLNDMDTLRTSPEGVALVPLSVSRGVRRGPREHLLETRRLLEEERAGQPADQPFLGELRIALNVFARRVLFADAVEGKVPRAVGVEISEGHRLYDPARPAVPGETPRTRRVYARREILLCGGTFNTPQLLMLSGIGDRAHLAQHGIPGLTGADGETSSGIIIDLPGVGGNLRDRCEISVISEMAKPFETLTKTHARFNPDDPDDPNAKPDDALAAWKAEGKARPRAGLYTTNGAALAILKRSPDRPDKPKNLPPDLLILAFPAAFRGYYPGWSKDLLHRSASFKLGREATRYYPEWSKELLRHRHENDDEVHCNFWSWTILKAYSVNCGSVRLRTADPFAPPDIDFNYFGDCADDCNDFNGDMKHDDLAALKFGVKYVRGLNRQASKLMRGGDADGAEIQPGKDKADDTRDLGDWIMKETWGHHAAGTCRIGSDPWRADPARDLKDEKAVLDSSFRVHGVRGLRVVDASVFPTIPGYFIATPTYMIGEKAADTILNELSR